MYSMYKQSQYNYFVPYCNKILYFNSLTKKSFLMTPQEHERLQKLFSDPISFEFGIPTVFNKFAEWGFFVKEEIDELAIFRYLYNRDILYSKECHLIIALPKNRKDNSDMVDSIKKHLTFLFKERITSLSIEWLGEESGADIDLYKHIIEEYAKKECHKAAIDYEQECPLIAPRVFQYTFYNQGIYSGKPTEYSMKNRIGVLELNGIINWDEKKRACQIGNVMIETAMCRDCKHIPLMSLSCQELLQKSHGVCPLKNNTIQPDWIVVQEYEMQKV